MLVQLNNQGSFKIEDVNKQLVVSIGESKYLVQFDSNDTPYIGYKGNKVLVTWF